MARSTNPEQATVQEQISTPRSSVAVVGDCLRPVSGPSDANVAKFWPAGTAFATERNGVAPKYPQEGDKRGKPVRCLAKARRLSRSSPVSHL
jgi:hypothetical protein